MGETSTSDSEGRSVQLRALIVDRAFTTIQVLIKFGFLAYALHEAQIAIGYIAGKTTIVSVLVSYLTKTREGSTIGGALTFAVVMAGWAVLERKLRYRKTERLQGRIRQLELQIDPNRTSSGLTPEGRTHPRDH